MTDSKITSITFSKAFYDLGEEAVATVRIAPGDPGRHSFSATVTDLSKQADSKGAAFTVNPPPSRVASLIGGDCARTDWYRTESLIGPMETHRMFFDGGSPPLPADFTTISSGFPAKVTLFISFKTISANLASFCKSVPDVYRVYMIPHHEPENDLPGPEFNTWFKKASDVIQSLHKPNVHVAMCNMTYAYRHGGSLDALSGDYMRGLGSISPVSGRPYADIFTADVYQHAGIPGGWPANGLQDYQRWLNWLRLITDSQIVGIQRPLGIMEYGVTYDPHNPNAWRTRIMNDVSYLKKTFSGGSSVSLYPLQVFCYWYHSNAPDLRFTDPDSIALWKSLYKA